MQRKRYGKGKSKFRVLAIVLSAVFLSQMIVLPASAVADAGKGASGAMTAAPLNPDYVTYMQDGAKSNTGEHGQGYIPPATNFSLGQLSGNTYRASITDSSYDLRTVNKVTPVENQGTSGCCWAFASIGSAESNYVINSGVSNTNNYFSENHMKNEMGSAAPYGYDRDTNLGGGNASVACAYFARWSGPVSIAADPYVADSVYNAAEDAMPAINHIMNVSWLPVRTGPTDNSTIKQAVLTYGAVFTAIKSPTTTYYNMAHGSLYNNNPNDKKADHAVDIVGWNDSYLASNFNTAPAGNGAFIAKNSWGSGFGDSGYFYISYYDLSVGYNENAVFYGVAPADNYSNIYAYDPFGNISFVGNGSSNTCYGAEVFTAKGPESLKAVSTYLGMPGSSYQVNIYLNPAAGNPTSGTLVSNATTTGSFTYAGYYNIPLNNPVSLTPGQSFAVVIQYTTPGSTYPVPYQYAMAGVSSKATAKSGQSFLSINGSTWVDAKDFNSTATVNIDAFTTNTPVSISALTPYKASPQPAGTTVTWICIASGKTQLQYEFFTYSSSAGWQLAQAYSPSNTFSWTPTAAGDYQICVWVKDPSSINSYDAIRTAAYTVSTAGAQPITVSPDAKQSEPANDRYGCHMDLQRQRWDLVTI